METLEGIKTRILGVRFRACGKVFFYETDDPEIRPGDSVVVQSMFGLTIGTVVKEVRSSTEFKDLKKIIRKATQEDLKKMQDNRELEKEAFDFCLERIRARGLAMKLVATEAMLDRKRIVFYFTAEGRIDFRELVKDLAAKYRTRIEMRQIGVRDEAKILGGIGICGRTLCCCTFLDNFVPISVRMAKEQELVLNTTKLTGLCGRLMCCLSYEYEGTIDGEDEIPVETEDNNICQECPSDTVSSLLSIVEDEPEDSQEETTEVSTEETVEKELVEIKEPADQQVQTVEQVQDQISEEFHHAADRAVPEKRQKTETRDREHKRLKAERRRRRRKRKKHKRRR